MIALLDLPLELPLDAPARKAGLTLFTSGLPEYLARCTSLSLSLSLSYFDSYVLTSLGQTYEGGFSGSPGTEAHGAYTYCAVACLCIMGHPRTMLRYPIPNYFV